jgi:hypothetical protein
MFRLLTEPSSGVYVTKTAYIHKRLFIGSLFKHNFINFTFIDVQSYFALVLN